jgi:hypothetical protein
MSRKFFHPFSSKYENNKSMTSIIDLHDSSELENEKDYEEKKMSNGNNNSG